MHVQYKTQGTCSSMIDFDLEDNIIRNIRFTNGCPGNTQGVSLLAEGMDADEVVRRLEGVLCGRRGTSCPDQLAKAIKSAR